MTDDVDARVAAAFGESVVKTLQASVQAAASLPPPVEASSVPSPDLAAALPSSVQAVACSEECQQLAAYSCADGCNAAFCAAHWQQVHAFKALAEHRQQAVGVATAGRCPAHPRQQLVMTCTHSSCSGRLLCVDCYLSEQHHQHTACSVADQALQLQQALRHRLAALAQRLGSVDALASRLRADAGQLQQRQSPDAGQLLDQVFATVARLLQRRHDQLLERLQHTAAWHAQQLAAQLTACQQLAQRALLVRQRAEQLLADASPLQTVQLAPAHHADVASLCHAIDQLIVHDTSSHAVQHVDAVYAADLLRLIQFVDSAGLSIDLPSAPILFFQSQQSQSQPQEHSQQFQQTEDFQQEEIEREKASSGRSSLRASWGDEETRRKWLAASVADDPDLQENALFDGFVRLHERVDGRWLNRNEVRLRVLTKRGMETADSDSSRIVVRMPGTHLLVANLLITPLTRVALARGGLRLAIASSPTTITTFFVRPYSDPAHIEQLYTILLAEIARASDLPPPSADAAAAAASGQTTALTTAVNCSQAPFYSALRNLKEQRSNLTSLNFDELGLIDQDLLSLLDVLTDTANTVRVLLLDGNRLTDVSGTALALFMADNTSIYRLSASDNQLTEDSFVALADALRTNTALRLIALFANLVQNRARCNDAFVAALKANPDRPVASHWWLYDIENDDLPQLRQAAADPNYQPGAVADAATTDQSATDAAWPVEAVAASAGWVDSSTWQFDTTGKHKSDSDDDSSSKDSSSSSSSSSSSDDNNNSGFTFSSDFEPLRISFGTTDESGFESLRFSVGEFGRSLQLSSESVSGFGSSPPSPDSVSGFGSLPPDAETNESVAGFGSLQLDFEANQSDGASFEAVVEANQSDGASFEAVGFALDASSEPMDVTMASDGALPSTSRRLSAAKALRVPARRRRF